MGIERFDDLVQIFLFLIHGLGKPVRPEAVEQSIPARWGRSCASTRGDPAHPRNPLHPNTLVVDAGLPGLRAGPSDEGCSDSSDYADAPDRPVTGIDAARHEPRIGIGTASGGFYF